MNIFLSIVIPVCNAEKTVPRCLESIWSQHLPEEEFEVICVDDCSRDASVSVLRDIRKKHKELHLLSHTVNLHAGGARNTGVRAAAGKYILFIDADDYFHPECLKKAFDHLKSNPDLDILTCNFARELPESPNDRFVHPYASEEKLSPAEYIRKNHVPCGPCQWFFRKSLMTDHDIRFREHTVCEDADWTHRLILKAERIQYQPVLLSHYVIDRGTQTALSCTEPDGVYAYMDAGRALYQLKEDYASVGHEDYLLGMAKRYICQGLKYYLAVHDTVERKARMMEERIPHELTLGKRWELCRRMPRGYALLSNLLSPAVCFLLKQKAKQIFRGIRVK